MKTISCIIGSLLLTLSAYAWTPPIGIPAPNWGPTIGNPIDKPAPKPPTNWTSNIPNVYYVQSGGTNQNEGFPGNPRNAIPMALPAGSVVFVNGTYTQSHDPYYIRHAGTAESPCWILSYDPLKPAIATKKWIIADLVGQPCSYLIIDNIDWDWTAAGGAIEIGGGVDHLCIRNGSTLGKGIIDPNDPNFGSSEPQYHASGIMVQSSGSLVDNPTEQIVIANMSISRGGNWGYSDPEADPDAHGISAAFPVKDLWFVDNEISYFSGSGLQIGAGSIDATPDEKCVQRTYIGRNHIHHIAQAGVGLKRTQDTIISQNILHDMRRDTPSSPNAAGIVVQYGPRDLWCICNTIYNCQGGIAVAAGTDNTPPHTDTDIYIVGNVIYNIHDLYGPIDNWRENAHSGGGVLILLRGGLDHYIINNTFDDYDAGVMSPIIGHNRYIEGNIFTNRNGAVSGGDVILTGDAGGSNVIKNNIIQEIVGGSYIRSGDPIYQTVSALNGAKGPGNSKVVPTYVNSGVGNYALTESSSGVDGFGSTENKVYELFRTKYGRSINADRNGGVRPFNNAWDIGAFEFGASPTTVESPPPSRPTGVKVVGPK